jgi:hypothetical protein
MVSALPAMSANSAPGLRGRISVATIGCGCELEDNICAKQEKRTSKDDTKIARRHQVVLVVFLNSASESHTSARVRNAMRGANEPVQVEHEGAKGIIMLCRKLLNQVGVFGALDDGILDGRREYELVVKGKCQ